VGKKDKGAKARRTKLPEKAAKAAPPAVSSQHETPFFCFRHADRATANEWSFKPDAAEAPGLFTFLCDMGRRKWSEIDADTTGTFKRHRKHHTQAISSVDTKAQKDIAQLRLDEVFGEDLFRFRLTGEKRLWGFRAQRTFHVVWWDPNHQVYPTEPN
jgi:hypothetical protein